MNILNPVNYDNKEIWDELNNNADSACVQNVLCPTYLPQETVNITQPQKSIITYGNVTPLSPNQNKLLTNYVDGITGNKLIDGATFISDINSPALKENVEIIQQQSDLIDNNILALSSSSFTSPDLKAINSGKLSLIQNINNEEIMAANTLLGPKNGINNTSLLTDVVLMPANSYSNSYSSISQETVLPTAVQTTINPSKLSTTSFAQTYQKVNKDFYSPMLSPTINQIYPNKKLGVQNKPLVTNSKTVPLIKNTINKKANKFSNSFSAVNLKAINPRFLRTNIIINKKIDEPLVNKMNIDSNNVLKEKETLILNNSVIPPTMNIDKTFSKHPSNILLNKSVLVEEPLEIDTVLMTPNSSSSINLNEVITKNEDKSEKDNNKELNKDHSEVVKMEIEKSVVNLEKEKKETPKEEPTLNVNKESKSSLENKKETKTLITYINKNIEETKKKDNKCKDDSLLEKTSKNKSEDKKETKDKSSTSSSLPPLKETDNSKKDTKKDSTSDSAKPKKRPRFSAKNAKNDPAAIEAHVLLKRKRNTEAARRSRQRKVQQMKNLEETVQRLTKELEETNNELKDVKEKYEKIVEESKVSKEAYEIKIKSLEEQLKKYNP